MGYAQGGRSAEGSRNTVGDDLYRETSGNHGTVGSVTPNIRSVQGRRATKGLDSVGRLGGAKRQQINNSGTPWQESRGRIRGGGDWDRTSCSRTRRETGGQVGK